jgi:putative glycosyl hydrolase-like family 15 (GHL15) protein
MLTRRDFALLSAAPLLAADAPSERVAFHYQSHFPPEALAWYTRFDVLVAGAILSPETSQRLRERGTKLVAYEWSSAFYPDDEASAPAAWQDGMKTRLSDWMLNQTPISGGAALDGKRAYWYDFSNAEFRQHRAAYLAGRLEESGYDGLFFDTLGYEQLPPPIRRAYRERSGRDDYNRAQGAFLAELRQRIGFGRIIFTNQGYRQPDHFLPHSDLDLSESYFTFQSNGGTTFRPWHDSAKPWDAVRTPMDKLIEPAAAQFPKVRFVHLNYAAGDPDTVRRAARYSFACARLWNHQSYLVAPAPAAEVEEIYFAELGRPVDKGYRENSAANVAWREYQHAVVAINAGPGPATIPGGFELPEFPQGYVLRK